jgi:ribosomal protein L7/L12
MANKIKQNLIYFFNAGLGVLAFILYAIPYVTIKSPRTRTFNGYRIIGRLFSVGLEGPICSIIQILTLILGISMLVYGILGILKALGIVSIIPDKIGKFEDKRLGFIALIVYAGLNLVLFGEFIFLCFENFLFDYVRSIAPHAGLFIAVIVSWCAVLAYRILCDVLEPKEDYVKEEYRCSKCNKRARKSAKFCSECGGEIVKTETVVEVDKKCDYFCSKCFANAKKGEQFCSVCGGKVISSLDEDEETDAPLFDVVLTSKGNNILRTVKALMSCTDMNLMDAKKCAESAPMAVAERISEPKARRIEKLITESGATVELIALAASEATVKEEKIEEEEITAAAEEEITVVTEEETEAE